MEESRLEIYHKSVRRFINNSENRAALSTDIADALIEEFSLENSNAKKIVSRLAKNRMIYTSDPLRFKDGAFACSTYEGYSQYRLLVMKHMPLLNAVLDRFKNNKGIISYFEIAKLSACLNEKVENYHALYIDHIVMLVNLFIPSDSIEEEGESFLVEKENSSLFSELYKELKNKETINARLLSLVIRYFQGIGLINGTPLYRGISIPFSGVTQRHLLFDATSFSNITKIQTDKKCVALFDCSFFDRYTAEDFQGFAARVDRLKNSTKQMSGQQRILPIIAARHIDLSTQNAARDKGMICVTTFQIFGQKFEEIADIIVNGEMEDANQQEKILNCIESAGQEENLSPIKGQIFELLVSRLVDQLLRSRSIQMASSYNGKYFKPSKIGKNKEEAEIDILLQNHTSKKVVAIECKSTKYPLIWYREEDAKKDFQCSHYFYHVGSIVKANFAGMSIELCIITANGFNDETISKASGINNTILSPCLTVMEIIAELKKKNITVATEERIVKKYFLNQDLMNQHPQTCDPLHCDVVTRDD
jgi:hypothetical protein